MLRVVNLTQHYSVKPVLRDVNLHVPAGETVVILGPNGMGKSTLLAAMAGVHQPQSGHVEINGLKRRWSIEAELEIRKQVAYLPDQAWLPVALTIREFLLSIGELYDVKTTRLFDHIERLLTLLELLPLGDTPLRSFSAGQKKKAALCSALITEAPVMILDEPFSGGLDPSGILALKHVFARFTHDRNRTIVMATPVPELVEEIADRIVVLHEGQIIASGFFQELQQQTECDGSLSNVLERLIFSETLANVDNYFEGNVE